MLGCAEAYRKKAYGENRAVNTTICKRQLNSRSWCTASTDVRDCSRWHCISLCIRMAFPEAVAQVCGGSSISINTTHWRCKKQTRETETNYTGMCRILPRLSDAVGWLQRSKMLCSTCSLIMPYFRTKEQSDYALKATWSKEFRKSLLNHFPRCFYQTVLGQIHPFSFNSLSRSISLLLLKSIHKQKIKTFPKEMTTLTHYLV